MLQLKTKLLEVCPYSFILKNSINIWLYLMLSTGTPMADSTLLVVMKLLSILVLLVLASVSLPTIAVGPKNNESLQATILNDSTLANLKKRKLLMVKDTLKQLFCRLENIVRQVIISNAKVVYTRVYLLHDFTFCLSILSGRIIGSLHMPVWLVVEIGLLAFVAKERYFKKTYLNIRYILIQIGFIVLVSSMTLITYFDW